MSAILETLIPHRPPMRWVNALTQCTDTTATATVMLLISGAVSCEDQPIVSGELTLYA